MIINIEGYMLNIDITKYWCQISITPTSGITHYMRLSKYNTKELIDYLQANIAKMDSD
jgi:hypothetical protein